MKCDHWSQLNITGETQLRSTCATTQTEPCTKADQIGQKKEKSIFYIFFDADSTTVINNL